MHAPTNMHTNNHIYTFVFVYVFTQPSWGWCPRVVMVKALDRGIVIS